MVHLALPLHQTVSVTQFADPEDQVDSAQVYCDGRMSRGVTGRYRTRPQPFEQAGSGKHEPAVVL